MANKIDKDAIINGAKDLTAYLVTASKNTYRFISNHDNFKDDKSIGATAVTSLGVGAVFGLGVGMFLFSSHYNDLGLFLVFWSVFHAFEWIFVATTDPKELSTNSFLINHSRDFTIAIAACFVEYIIESIFVPGLKNIKIFTFVGFVITLAGQVLRTLAQFHAKHNFTHQVQEQKRTEHVLVEDGPYRYIRHPGYLGWYWWAVGTQILVFNPICILGYAFVAWKFFQSRIEYEEEYLSSPAMFGEKYRQYKARTPTYLPFIN